MAQAAPLASQSSQTPVTASKKDETPARTGSSRGVQRSALRGRTLAEQDAMLAPPPESGAVQMKGGTPLFEDPGLLPDIAVKTDGLGSGDSGVSASVTSTAQGRVSDDPVKREEQLQAALQADAERWAGRRIEVDSALAVARTDLAAAEAAVATSQYGDQEAQARVDALRTQVGCLEKDVAQAALVDGIRQGQLAQVAGGTKVGELTRVDGDPGVVAVGAPLSTTKISGEVHAGGASAAIEDSARDGTQTKTAAHLDLSDGVSAGVARTKQKGTDKSSTSATAKLSDKGATATFADASRDGSATRSSSVTATVEIDHLALGTKESVGTDTTDKDGNGAKRSFSVSPTIGAKVSVAPNAAKTAFVLSGEVYFSVGASASASAQDTVKHGGEDSAHGATTKRTVGGSGSASLKGSLSMLKPLTDDEAVAYTGDLKASADGDAMPSFGWLAAWRAALDQLASGGATSGALSDPGKAAGMRDGESYKSSMETSWSYCIKAGVGVASGSGGQSGKGTRYSHVAKSPEGISLTLSFGTEAGYNADGSVTFEGVTMGLGTQGKQTYGALVTFLVDPNDSERFSEILKRLDGASSVDDLIALRQQYAADVHAFNESQGSATTQTVTMGVGGAELAIAESTERDTARTKEGVTASGGSGIAADFKVADTSLLSGSVKDKGTFEANAEGVSADLTTTTEATAVGLEAGEWTPSALWKSLVGGGVKGSLAERLTIPRKSIAHVTVSPEGMRELLTVRVHQTATWNSVKHITPSNYRQWETLRQRLVSPSPTPEDIKQYGAALARLIDNSEALADFMTALHAKDVVESALNNWGDTNSTADLGVHVAFPSSLVAEDAKFLSAVEKAKKARTSLAALANGEDGVTKVGTSATAMITELTRLKILINGHISEFEDTRTPLEMVDACDTGVIEVRKAKSEVLAALDAGYDPTQTSVDVDTSAEDTKRIGQLETLMRDYKAREKDLFLRMKEGLSSYQTEQHKDDWLPGGATAGMLMADDWRPLSAQYGEMCEMWVVKIKELRAAYIDSSWELDRFKVSFDKGDLRNAEHEPDIDGYEAILRGYSEQESVYHLNNDPGKKRWLKDYRAY